MRSHRAPLPPTTAISVSLAAAAGASRSRPRSRSSIWRLLGFLAFWAALAAWSGWLLGATGLVAWTPDGISMDLPWWGWLVLLAWGAWLVGAIDHQWPRSQAARPQRRRAPAAGSEPRLLSAS